MLYYGSNLTNNDENKIAHIPNLQFTTFVSKIVTVILGLLHRIFIIESTSLMPCIQVLTLWTLKKQIVWDFFFLKA